MKIKIDKEEINKGLNKELEIIRQKLSMLDREEEDLKQTRARLLAEEKVLYNILDYIEGKYSSILKGD